MNRSRRRRNLLAWCRYLARNQVPFSDWLHRAPGCDNPRPSGFARAWDRVALHARSWPWRPRFNEGGGRRPGGSAVMAHDLPRTVTVELPERDAA